MKPLGQKPRHLGLLSVLVHCNFYVIKIYCPDNLLMPICVLTTHDAASAIKELAPKKQKHVGKMGTRSRARRINHSSYIKNK